jgi:hypothetical protein
MRRAPIFIAMLVALSTLIAGPVAAARPIGGCGNPSFSTMTFEAFREMSRELGVPGELLDSPEYAAHFAKIDKNNDNLVCVKDLPDNAGTLFGWIFNVVDNTANH